MPCIAPRAKGAIDDHPTRRSMDKSALPGSTAALSRLTYRLCNRELSAQASFVIVADADDNILFDADLFERGCAPSSGTVPAMSRYPPTSLEDLGRTGA